MKIFILSLVLLFCAVPALAQQSGYGGDGKAASGASVSSFIRLYETAPGAATTALAGAGAGNVDNGAHLVRVTCYTPGGETTGGTASNSTTVADKTTNGKIALTGIPTCSSVATGRKIYMTAAGGSSYFLLSNGTITNNTATTLTANDADATLTASTALPTSNTALDNRVSINQSNVILGVPLLRLTDSADSVTAEVGAYTSGIGFGTSSTAAQLLIHPSGLTQSLYINSASRAIFRGDGISSFGGTNLLFKPDNSGTAGNYVALQGWNGSNWFNGVTVLNKASGNIDVNLVPAGGIVQIGPGTVADRIGAGPSHGQNINIIQGEELLTIAAAATTDTAMTIPANAVVLAVSVRVTTVIPTAATFTVIGTSSSTVFNTAAVAVAAGTTDPGTKAGAYFNGTAQTIRITPNLQPADNTGRVRVTVTYYVVTPPTS